MQGRTLVLWSNSIFNRKRKLPIMKDLPGAVKMFVMVINGIETCYNKQRKKLA